MEHKQKTQMLVFIVLFVSITFRKIVKVFQKHGGAKVPPGILYFNSMGVM